VSSAITAFATDEFTPDPDTARVLGTAGAVVGLTGLTGGAAMVTVTTRAVLCLSGFWSGGIASVALALWLIAAVIGVLRAARRTPPKAAVPAALGAPSAETARTPPTSTRG
jgi:hypothetical protein